MMNNFLKSDFSHHLGSLEISLLFQTITFTPYTVAVKQKQIAYLPKNTELFIKQILNCLSLGMRTTNNK